MPGHKRILQITSYPPPPTGWGVRVQFLKRHLERQGHECVVLNIGPSRTTPSDEYETVLGAWDYLRKMWHFSRRGFVAHVHVNGASPKGFVIAIAAELINLISGERCFLTFHAGVEQVYFPRPKYPLLLPVFWTMFALPKVIICNSEAVKAKIVEYGVRPAKVFPIPAFSRQYLESRDGALPAALEDVYRTHPEVIFCYTKIRPLFYPVTLIEGFARVAQARPGVALVLCGVGDYKEPDLWRDVEAAVARHGLRDRIIVLDELAHEAFLNALARATIYLRSHLSDGVCSSVLESLALGVPVVASENGTRPPGVIKYPSDDPDALAAAVIDVLARREQVVAGLPRQEITDTLDVEARLLTA